VRRKAGRSLGKLSAATTPTMRCPQAPQARAELAGAARGLDGRIVRQVETALVGDPGVSHQRDVRQGKPVADQIGRLFQLCFQTRQGAGAALDQLGVQLLDRLAQIDDLEAGHRDIRLVAVLLPEQPLVHLGPLERVAGDQRRALGQMQHDGVRLGQGPTVLEDHRRHLPGRVHRQELRGPRLRLQDVDLDPFKRLGQVLRDPFHLQAVARDRVAKDAEGHAGFLL
jgi:hypothetical protein